MVSKKILYIQLASVLVNEFLHYITNEFFPFFSYTTGVFLYGFVGFLIAIWCIITYIRWEKKTAMVQMLCIATFVLCLSALGVVMMHIKHIYQYGWYPPFS